MMFINVAGTDYELATKLGTGMAIERKFKIPVMQLFSKLDQAETNELITILAIAAKKVNDKFEIEQEFRTAIIENWDYSDLFGAVQELVARIMYSGTPEENEKKLAKLPITEHEKNLVRKLLGMPLPKTEPAPEASGDDL